MSVHMPGNTMYGVTKMFLGGFSGRHNLEVGRHGIEMQSMISGCTISNFDKTENYKASLRAAIPTFSGRPPNRWWRHLCLLVCGSGR